MYNIVELIYLNCNHITSILLFYTCLSRFKSMKLFLHLLYTIILVFTPQFIANIHYLCRFVESLSP